MFLADRRGFKPNDEAGARKSIGFVARSFMPDYTILLIDYDPRSIERLRDPLVKAGLRVEVAKDGLAGIKRFHELRPDLTLIEAMIPKKHGFEVCQELKKTPHGQASAVLIITSVYKGRKYRTQAMHSYRCDEYLEKPISDETLVAVVKRHLPQLADDPQTPAPAAASAPTQEGRKAGPAPDDNPLRDVSDAEVLDRLDALLPEDLVGAQGDGPHRVDDAVEPASGTGTPRNVVRFDVERVRARPATDTFGPVAERPSPLLPRRPFAGGSQPALAHEHLETTVAQPTIELRSAPGTAETQPAGPAARSGSRERLYFWIALVLAAMLTAVLALIVAF